MHPNKKRLLLLSDINSAHTRRWAEALALEGLAIGIFSISQPTLDWFSKNKNIVILSDSTTHPPLFHQTELKKIYYLKYLPTLKKAIREFKPALLHAHYATSYGLLGMLTGFHPFIISAWGSDVIEFPKNNILKKFLLKKILSSADKLLATSLTTQKYVHQVLSKEVSITPFGIDANLFKPNATYPLFEKNTLVIGTIKSLEKMYSIDVLIKAFALLKKEVPNCKLLLIGEGTQRKNLEQLANELQIANDVIFKGKILYEEIVDYHNKIDIFFNISGNESFGVAILEAMACERAVVATNTGGPAEIIENDSIGLKTPAFDVEALCKKLKHLATHPELRKELGKNARQHILKKYTIEIGMKKMLAVYKEFGL
jgi:L-malate glycosyltransferase